MVVTTVPTVQQLKSGGRFIGYTANGGLYECFSWYKQNWCIVDGVSNGKYYTYVELYKGKISDLCQSLHPVDGCLQFSKDTERPNQHA